MKRANVHTDTKRQPKQPRTHDDGVLNNQKKPFKTKQQQQKQRIKSDDEEEEEEDDDDMEEEEEEGQIATQQRHHRGASSSRRQSARGAAHISTASTSTCTSTSTRSSRGSVKGVGQQPLQLLRDWLGEARAQDVEYLIFNDDVKESAAPGYVRYMRVG